MTMRYDPDTGYPLYTEEQVRQIVKEAIDALVAHNLWGVVLSQIMNRAHDPERADSDAAA